MDGMLKNSWLLSFLVEMLDSGAPGWVLGGEMVLLTADGGSWDDWLLDDWLLDDCAGRVTARRACRLRLFS